MPMHPAALICRIIVPLLIVSSLIATEEPQEIVPGEADYTFMWWAYGWRGRSPEDTRLLCFQSGRFGMAFDVDRLRLTRLGTIDGARPYHLAVADANDVVLNLPPAELRLEVTVGGKRYRCTAGGAPGRIVESGRLFQRFDVLDLIFEDEQHRKLDVVGRLEVAVWPDRASLLLEVAPGEGPDAPKELQPVVTLTHRNGTVSTGRAQDGDKQVAWLAWYPEDSSERSEAAVAAADRNNNDRPLKAEYEPAHGWYRIELPTERWSPGEDFDHLQRVWLRLSNDGDRPRRVRLLASMESSFAGITGMSPMLRDADGYPTGVPVQISKNWHRGRGRDPYQGPWFHGFMFFDLPPRSSQDYELTIAYARWGGVPAASHAQLCLIGWGANQLWDEAAIGSWGESLCFEPDQAQRGGTVLDSRPLMVWAMKQDKPVKWRWTNNVGGADFLVYYDAEGQKQWNSRMRTAYRRYGPNLTEVTYAGRSADAKIDLRTTVSLCRGDDVVRGIYRFRYDVRQPVDFSRLVLFQCGGDDYSYTGERKFAIGNEDGLIEEWETQWGGDVYRRTGLKCTGRVPWLSMHEAVARDKSKSGAWANRGFIIRRWQARLGGKPAVPYAAERGAKVRGSDTSLIDILPPPHLKRLEQGDYVEAEVVHVVMPQYAADYYGPNENLRLALARDENTWRMIYREAVGNDLRVSALRGTVLRRYPVSIRVDGSQEADFTVTGGIGYVPITFTALKHYRGWRLERLDGDRWTPIDQSVHGNDYWQADYQSHAGTWQLTYNVSLDSPGDERRTEQFRIRPK